MKLSSAPSSGSSGFTASYDRTGVRAIDGKVYHNTTGLPMLVIVYGSSVANELWRVFSDPTATPTLLICLVTTGTGNANPCLVFIVPPNYYYFVSTSGAGTLTKWTEIY